MDPYQIMANAIVLRATEDYRDVALFLEYHRPIRKEDKDDKAYISALADKNSIERFFLGNWFTTLSDLDGKVLLEKLKSEVP